MVNGTPRNRIARVSRLDGSLDEIWGLEVLGTYGVYALAIDDLYVYVGGGFTEIGGESRSGIARLFKSDGSVDLGWNPNAGGVSSPAVRGLIVEDDYVYVSGGFTTIGGESRNYIARLDKTTGAADLGWNPNASQEVVSLAATDDHIYAGGYGFTLIGGLSRNNIAKLKKTDGTAEAGWNANMPGTGVRIIGIEVSGGYVYMVGEYSSVAGEDRRGIARVMESSGGLSTWDPGANEYSYAIAVSGTKIVAGGCFSAAGYRSFPLVARILLETGELDLGWNQTVFDEINGSIIAIDTDEQYVLHSTLNPNT